MSFNDISLTDDDPLFRETHYARYGYERTPDEFPSARIDKLPAEAAPEYTQPLSKPVRHFLAASLSELTAFISRDGYWNCLCISLGLEAGKSEVIAIDAVESSVDDKISLFVALAVAEVSVGYVSSRPSIMFMSFYTCRNLKRTRTKSHHFHILLGSMEAIQKRNRF
ncbi:hypothetical protein BD408DRAFT_348079 [Parasitella parasitica]|nr:hypothetical protein BD408DRAFT_348079 [Parasitella parasitica]